MAGALVHTVGSTASSCCVRGSRSAVMALATASGRTSRLVSRFSRYSPTSAASLAGVSSARLMRNRSAAPGTVTDTSAVSRFGGTFQRVPLRSTFAATPPRRSRTGALSAGSLRMRALTRHDAPSPLQTNSGAASSMPPASSTARRRTASRLGGVVKATSKETARSPSRSGSIHTFASAESAASGGVANAAPVPVSRMRDGRGRPSSERAYAVASGHGLRGRNSSVAPSLQRHSPGMSGESRSPRTGAPSSPGAAEQRAFQFFPYAFLQAASSGASVTDSASVPASGAVRTAST